jgi:hypothetical protein
MLFRLIRLYDIKNEIPSQFPQRGNFVRTWGLPSHLPEGDVPCPPRALLTVFSITQSDHFITLLSIHDIADFEMYPDVIFCLIKGRLQSNMKTL